MCAVRDSTLLHCEGIEMAYGPVQILFGVDFDVTEGEIVALLGTNGAGKSTLLRAVSGLGVPDRGVVRLNGRAITYSSATERVRFGVVQMSGGRATFRRLSVADNLAAGAYTLALDPGLAQERIERAYRLFPILRERAAQPAGALSGGEQQMLAMAKALLLDPEVLLIDELTLGLAPVVTEQLLRVVEGLKAEGLSVVIVEQSLNVATAVADRAIFLEKGRVRFEGRPDELLDRDDLVRAIFLEGR
jgi:ABC-type branched-subunit amino acid transport system ATPase component